jgi:hypothetical protein
MKRYGVCCSSYALSSESVYKTQALSVSATYYRQLIYFCRPFAFTFSSILITAAQLDYFIHF